MELFWLKTINETAGLLNSNTNTGLSAADAETRLKKYGPNQLLEKKGYSPWTIFIDQFKDFIIWILVSASVVSGLLGEWIDAGAIIAIVIVNALLGFFQEYRAEKSLAALKKLSSFVSKVIRDGQRAQVPSAELVPGDLIELEAGDNVPADSRIVWMSAQFSVQEASLTGESTPVEKTAECLQDKKEVPLAERANMVFMGTSVSSGKARALVTSTGMSTQLGAIAGMIQQISRETTPLQKKLEKFGQWLVWFCLGVVGIVFLLEWYRGGKLVDVLLTSVSLAVAAIPEGLPAVVTIALALGVQRMVKRNALIRKLPSVETLGSATVICSDKTGTLTKNEMTVKVVYTSGRLFEVGGSGYEIAGEFSLDGNPVEPSGYPDLEHALLASVLCNNAELKIAASPRILGDPTEGSLLVAAAKAGLDKTRAEAEFGFVDELPFDSGRKKMTVLRRSLKGEYFVFTKGAADVLLSDCAYIQEGAIVRTLEARDREAIMRTNDLLADKAMRILAVATRKIAGDLPKVMSPATLENGLTFLGMAAMIDPARPEAKRAIALCKSAGIRTVMITGDHKNTAVAIGRDLGFFDAGAGALTGADIDALTDEEFKRQVRKVSVYARVSPEHKLRIVKALRAQGEVVAMTGDGVNDAPAVKEADIGIAMGITGTDVTKEVSDMVITDDNFASIVFAIEEGRGIYDNIKKFIHYLLSCNAGEILVMLTASITGLPVPLLPIHILWVNLVTDGLPALALGMDPVSPLVMKVPPRGRHEAVLTKNSALLMLAQGSFIACCSLLAFAFVLFVEKEPLARARTAAFVVLSCSQLFHAFNCRSQSLSIFKLGLFSNPKLILAAGISFVLTMAAVYLPMLQTVFKTEALGAFDWILVISISSLPLAAMELVKFFSRRPEIK